MRRLLKPALWFLTIGLALYAGLYVASERLVERTAHGNPLHKIAALQKSLSDRNVRFDETTARELFLFLIQPVLSRIRSHDAIRKYPALTEPRPPKRLVPPMTAAAMALSKTLPLPEP